MEIYWHLMRYIYNSILQPYNITLHSKVTYPYLANTTAKTTFPNRASSSTNDCR